MMTEKGPFIQTVKTRDFEMEYFTFGRGDRPFLMLPGLSLHTVMDSRQAVAQAYAAFEEAYTIYVMDVPKTIPEGYSISDLADDTAAALSVLGVRGADVLGCSMGGIRAAYLAARHPELIRKMVLASTAGRPNETSRQVMQAWAALAKKGETRPLNHLVTEKVYSPAFIQKFAAAFAALEDQGTAEEMSAFSILAHAIGIASPWEEMQKIAAETLVIGSWGDQVFTGNASVEIAEKLCCPLYLYSGYGHAAYDEAPDYKKRLLDFFLA